MLQVGSQRQPKKKRNILRKRKFESKIGGEERAAKRKIENRGVQTMLFLETPTTGLVK